MRRFLSHSLIAFVVTFATVASAPWAWAQEKKPQKPTTPTTNTSKPSRSDSRPHAIRLRVEGNVGYTSFAATESFKATLGTSSGMNYGGGAGFLIGRSLFVDVEATRFSDKGERVFIGPNRQRFSLGIPLETEVLPIDVSAGWRFTRRPGPGPRTRASLRIVPFLGAGIGVVKYKETAKFAQTGEDVDDAFVSYHIVGGAEFPLSRHIGVTGDALYRWVPDALGAGGVSKAFGESDLGGLGIRVRGIFTF